VTFFFALVFGGTIQDAIAAGINGIFINFMLRLSKRFRMSAFMENVICSVALAVGAVVMSWIPGFMIHVEPVIVSSIMPIVPGAAFTTAIRDTLQGDYIAGGAKALEALVKVVAIVVGVGLGIRLTGGIMI